MIRIEKKLALPPDLYSRNTLYTYLFELLLKASASPLQTFHILDLGGYDGRLSWFMPPNIRITILDSKPAPNGKNSTYQMGDATKTGFPDNSFDLVISSDLIEHLKGEDRLLLISEMLRISKNFIILAAPFQNIFNQKAEEIIAEEYLNLTGSPHPFLIEHLSNGLPDATEVEAFFVSRNLPFVKIGEGNISNWLLQQLVAIKTSLHSPSYAKEFFTFFNSNLTRLGNFRPPHYRTVYLIGKNNPPRPEFIKFSVEEINNFHTSTYFEVLAKAFSYDKAIHTSTMQKAAKIVELEKDLSHLNHSQTSFQEKLSLLQKELDLTKTHADNLNKMLLSRTRQYEELQEKNKSLRDALDTISTENSRRALYIADLDFRLNSLSQLENALRLQINEKDSQIQEKNASLLSLNQELTTLQLSHAEYKKALESILNSRSWRLVKKYGHLKEKYYSLPKNKFQKVAFLLKSEGLSSVLKKISQKLFPKKQEVPYALLLPHITPSAADLKNLQTQIESFLYKPLISIVVPAYNVDAIWLHKMIASVQNQIYPKWELLIADDGSTRPYMRPLFDKYSAKDPRIRITYREKNGGIVEASASAAKLARGAYIALLDADDELSKNALFEVVKVLQTKKYDLIYSDEDKLDLKNNRVEPYFKSDFNRELLFCNNYICHFSVIRRKVFEEVGGFRKGTDGAQDHDLMLRITDQPRSIYHIPKILYHWRKIPGSTAATPDAKPYVFANAKKAISDALKRRKISGEVHDGLFKGSYYVKRSLPSPLPEIAIIICFKDVLEVLRVAVESTLEKTSYPNYKIILINNQSKNTETLNYLSSLSSNPKIILDSFDEPFNYAKIYNIAAQKYNFPYFVQLNSDTEVITPDWLEVLLSQASRPEVAAVGCKLLYPNGHVQHAGVTIGIAGVANHSFAKTPDTPGYFGLIDSPRNVSAVTFAVVMMRRSVYLELGGMNQKDLAVAFNDTDYCLRAIEKGYEIIYTPHAKLFHHESYSRGYNVNFAEEKYFRDRHARILESGDPFYNPNLTQTRLDYSLKTP